MTRRSKDRRQIALDLESPKPINGSLVTLESIAGEAHTHPAAKESIDYNVNLETLRTLRSKVRRIGTSYSLSFEDHLKLARDIFHGVYEMESNLHGQFDGRYGVPHEILNSLTTSEILSLYRACHEYKLERQRPGIGPQERYKILKSKSFVSQILEFINSGQRGYNAISTMSGKERRSMSRLPLAQRLERISLQAAEQFYQALIQTRTPIRDPVDAAPRFHAQDVELFYLNGIDIYIGKLTSMFHQLYQMKAMAQAKPSNQI